MKPNNAEPAHGNSISTVWSSLQAVLGCIILLGVSGCFTLVDPEYEQKVTKAHADCTGQEVVGVWVSMTNDPLMYGSGTTILLIRPDGTGRLRIPHYGDTPLTWNYAGSGVWNASTEEYPDRAINIRFNGKELLFAETFQTAGCLKVFVRTDDEAAVKEHTQKRQ